jgi:hypothetical protein
MPSLAGVVSRKLVPSCFGVHRRLQCAHTTHKLPPHLSNTHTTPTHSYAITKGGGQLFLIASVVCVSACIAGGLFLAWNVFLLFSNQSTIEFYSNVFEREKGQPYKNAYSLGWKRNLREVFGYASSWPLLLLLLLPSRRQPDNIRHMTTTAANSSTGARRGAGGDGVGNGGGMSDVGVAEREGMVYEQSAVARRWLMSRHNIGDAVSASHVHNNAAASNDAYLSRMV